MNISKEAIIEFKDLYLKEYGIQLTDSEAMEQGLRLIRFVKAVYGDSLPEKLEIKNKVYK